MNRKSRCCVILKINFKSNQTYPTSQEICQTFSYKVCPTMRCEFISLKDKPFENVLKK